VDDARKLYDAALDLFAEKRFDEAVVAMKAILAKHPVFFDAYEGLAMAHSRLGDLECAIAVMEELAEKDPENPMSHTNLSVFYMKKGMKEKAEEEKAKATVLQFARLGKKQKL